MNWKPSQRYFVESECGLYRVAGFNNTPFKYHSYFRGVEIGKSNDPKEAKRICDQHSGVNQ